MHLQAHCPKDCQQILKDLQVDDGAELGLQQGGQDGVAVQLGVRGARGRHDHVGHPARVEPLDGGLQEKNLSPGALLKERTTQRGAGTVGSDEKGDIAAREGRTTRSLLAPIGGRRVPRRPKLTGPHRGAPSHTITRDMTRDAHKKAQGPHPIVCPRFH